jgi:putative oxidoreductase
MSDQTATAPTMSGPEAMTKLADRLATLAPAQHAFQGAQLQPQQDAEGAVAAEAGEHPRRRSFIRRMIDGFNAACAFIPYALVALALRLLMARVFFLDGQARVDGAPIPLTWRDFEFSVVLPLQLKAEAASVFWRVPHVPEAVTAWAVAGAEFALPLLLVAGLLTRFAALVLLGVTVLLQVFVMPEALWTAHVYWASILLVLMSLGAGQISLDALVKFLARR